MRKGWKRALKSEGGELKKEEIFRFWIYLSAFCFASHICVLKPFIPKYRPSMAFEVKLSFRDCKYGLISEFPLISQQIFLLPLCLGPVLLIRSSMIDIYAGPSWSKCICLSISNLAGQDPGH